MWNLYLLIRFLVQLVNMLCGEHSFWWHAISRSTTLNLTPRPAHHSQAAVVAY